MQKNDGNANASAADIQVPRQKARLCCSVRLMTAFFGFGSLLVHHCNLFSLSFGLICMVIPTTGNHTTGHGHPEFYWDRATQGLVLSAFYVGFAMTLLAGGITADTYQGKILLVIGALLQGAISLILPEMTRALGPIALGVMRIFQGLAGGLIVPSVFVLLVKWAAVNERTRLLGIAYLGVPLSSVLTYSISGLLCEITFDRGWPFIFYVTGSFTITLAILLQFLTYEWPNDHPFCSEKEKQYLEAHSVQKTDKKRLPWKKMVKSSAVWAYCFCHLAGLWGFQVMCVFIPDFMKAVLKFNIRENGFLSAVPFIGLFLTRIIQTSTFHWIRVKLNLSVTVFRKINHATGTLIPAISLICMLFVEDSAAACMVLLTINVAIEDLAFTGGFGFCHVDFAPAFAGLLSGIGMTAAVCLCIGMPNIVAALTPTGTHSEWMTIFYITAAINIMAFIIYNRFGTSELQPWGLGDPDTEIITTNNHKKKRNLSN